MCLHPPIQSPAMVEESDKATPPEPEPEPAPRALATHAEAKTAWAGFMCRTRTNQVSESAKIPKPRGPVPSDRYDKKVWDGVNGEWQSQGPPDAESAVDNDGDGDADASGASSSKRQKTARQFQAVSWTEVMPTLICVSLLVAGQVCPDHEDCRGCAACSAMFCEDCQLRGMKNNFVNGGCRDFHMKAIRSHQSIWHPPRIGGDVAEGLAKTIVAQQDRIKGIMKNVYWLGKENCALAKTKSLKHLATLHGVTLTEHYCNHLAAREFAMSLAHVIREDILSAARRNPAHGLMVDESTDVAQHGEMVLYLRILLLGAFVTVFWRIVRVDDASADGLFATIEHQYEEDMLPKERLFSFASDGASVMTGAVDGVAVRLRDAFNVFMLLCHCIAHCHALACTDAALDNHVADWFESVIHEILSYHSHSTKRKEHLEALQEALGINKLRLVRMVATRWLSRGQTVSRIFRIIAALISEFEEDKTANSNALAGPLVDMTRASKFITCLVLFNGILMLLNGLSRCFQSPDVRFKTVCTLLKSTKETLKEEYCDSNCFVGGPSYAPLKKSIDAAVSAAGAAAPPVNVENASKSIQYNQLGVVGLQRNADDENWVVDGVMQFASKIVERLTERFPGVPLFEALDIFDFTQWPGTLPPDFGNAEIEVLVGHFGHPRTDKQGMVHLRTVNPVQVRSEWHAFKRMLRDLKERGVSLSEGYDELLKDSTLPEVKVLACIFMVLCLSSVPCEQGFSLMANIKTKLRNCMNVETLDALMMISSNGPPMADTEAVLKLINRAFEHWLTVQKRCLARSHPVVARPKKNKNKTVPFHDILQEQQRRARAAKADRLSGIVDSDDEDEEQNGDDESKDEEQAGGMDQITTEEIQSSHGPYTPPKGWVTVALPADDEVAWADFKDKMKRGSAWWRGRRLAHIFDDGWDDGTFQGGTKDGHLVFYYKAVPMRYSHSLLFDEHGVGKSWVVIEKAA